MLKMLFEVLWIVGFGAALIIYIRNYDPSQDDDRISGDW